MTWTAAADAVMSACARSAAACPPTAGPPTAGPPTAGAPTGRTATAATALARRGRVERAAHGLARVWAASHGPEAVPTAARGARRHPGRPERASPPRPRYLAGLPRQREPGCVYRPHLIRRDLGTLGWPSDLGREVK
jgi:hypothetical protein